MTAVGTSEGHPLGLAQHQNADGRVDWPTFFRSFEAIALVANSSAADLVQFAERCPAETLFVFFNDVTRVLHGRFDRHAILVTRSGRSGSAVVRKNKIGSIVDRFHPERFYGVINLRTLDIELFDSAESLSSFTSARLDLIDFSANAYPAGKTPSSGFAIAVWLHAMALERPIFVSGFTGVRTERRKVFDSHDWTFEQIALRLMARKGQLVAPAHDQLAAKPGLDRLQAIVPEATVGDIMIAAAEVLSDRVNNLAYFVDRLWTVTKVARWVSTALAFVRGRRQDRR